MFLIHKLQMSLDIEEIRNYYQTVVCNFDHLKWTSSNDAVEPGVGNHEYENLYGWGIESNQLDQEKPCPPYNILQIKSEYQPTKLVFGLILKLKELFPNSHQYSIAGHPTGTFVNLHKDNDKYLKIHIPIYTNTQAMFLFENTKFHLPADGSMYLVNTQELHGTTNSGDTDRIHLFFKIPVSDSDRILEL